MTKDYLATVSCRGYEASFAFVSPPTLKDIIAAVEWSPLSSEIGDALLIDIRNVPADSLEKPIRFDLHVGDYTRIIVKRFYQWEG